jgi:DNA invertase Pin-like site-specific DNA recombinase
MKPIPVALLVRVSTDTQDTARQVTELTRIAAERGWTIIETVEETVSGNASERPGMDRILELARTGAIKKVLAHEVSRIARRNSVAHVFLDTLTDLGVSLFWLSQNIETLMPDGRRNPAAAIMFSLLAEMARAERETLIVRIRSGMEEARRNGKQFGRPKGSGLTDEAFLAKQGHVVQALSAGRSIRDAASLTGRSSGTVEKVRRLMGLTRSRKGRESGEEFEV